jgi:putative ABC transport system ATP-binding protein
MTSVQNNLAIQTIPEVVSTPLVIKLDQVFKIYGMGDTEVTALAGISLEIQKGEYCSIMGASGSGKSTAMNIIGCLDRPTSGNYYLDGDNVAQLSESQLAETRNLKIGFVFQQFHLLPQMSAMENVMLPMVYAGVKGNDQKVRAEAALKRMGLGHRLNNRPNQLSGGQQQRVAIARAIVNEPVLILADEPTGALDSKTTEEVIDIFSELNSSGITVVMVTHEADVARHSKRIVMFKDGHIVHSHLSPDDLGQSF